MRTLVSSLLLTSLLTACGDEAGTTIIVESPEDPTKNRSETFNESEDTKENDTKEEGVKVVEEGDLEPFEGKIGHLIYSTLGGEGHILESCNEYTYYNENEYDIVLDINTRETNLDGWNYGEVRAGGCPQENVATACNVKHGDEFTVWYDRTSYHYDQRLAWKNLDWQPWNNYCEEVDTGMILVDMHETITVVKSRDEWNATKPDIDIYPRTITYFENNGDLCVELYALNPDEVPAGYAAGVCPDAGLIDGRLLETQKSSILRIYRYNEAVDFPWNPDELTPITLDSWRSVSCDFTADGTITSSTDIYGWTPVGTDLEEDYAGYTDFAPNYGCENKAGLHELNL